ncbi:hypothetical protein [Halegenticoccus soli]|uniref:hypothetical protein n=1 Tax=Halegenticoccus soli TaxID=1985678 RepID=UPI000C6E43B7|nr:hypothetical protein [Halegenticoccus soli]
MLGPLAVGKKAAKYGYRRFGVPGAVLAGIGTAAGYVAVRKKLKSMLGGSDDESAGIADEMSDDESAADDRDEE